MGKNHKKSILLGICAIVLTAVSCNLGASVTPAPPTPTEASLALTEPTASPTLTETPTEIPATETSTETPTPTSTPSVVIVSATSSGSLGILRGTSVFYDTLGYLKNGQSSQAFARNEDGSWLYIVIPDYPQFYGWAFVGSQYSTIQGDVNSLYVRPVDPAVPAYIRNCTYHPMLIQPGNILLKGQSEAPNNKKQFPPGAYAAFDQSATGKPQVYSVTLKEGVSVDIKTDGLKNTYACP